MIILRYPQLGGLALRRNYGDRQWHIVATGGTRDVMCGSKCKDPETITDLEIDGTVCGHCIRVHDKIVTPRKVPIFQEPPKRTYIPPSINRTKPVAPNGIWKQQWATDPQKKTIKALYPEMPWMEINGLTGGEAHKLIESADVK